jgi:hypothetical protein
MNKSQREYAISRAKVLIAAKYTLEPIARPSSKDVQKALGFSSDSLNSIPERYSLSRLIEVAIFNHPSFFDFQQQHAKHDKQVLKNKAIELQLVQEAKDYIMLADQSAIMNYLQKLA